MLDDLDSMLDEAIIAHEAKDFNSAAAKYTKILERDAHHADANHNFGLLTVELGLKDEALIFLQTAINTNPKVLQYWVTFIDTLTKVERFDDARSVLEQANLFGYTEEVFDQLRHNLDLKQRLCEPLIKLGHANTTETVLDQVEQKLSVLNGPIIERQKLQTDESGVLGELKLDQALKLAKKKIKDGEYEEAKAIYEDILKKFSKNKRALDGLKSLSDKPGTNRPTIQEPPIDQLQGLVKLYTQGQFKQAQIQAQLADSLRMVVTQKLFKTADGKGRVGAFEIMVCNSPVKNLIREKKIHQIPSVMQTGTRDGMISMEKSIENLVQSGKISNVDSKQ